MRLCAQRSQLYICRSVPQIEAVSTRTSTSPADGSGRTASRSSAPAAASVFISARIIFFMPPWPLSLGCPPGKEFILHGGSWRITCRNEPRWPNWHVSMRFPHTRGGLFVSSSRGESFRCRKLKGCDTPLKTIAIIGNSLMLNRNPFLPSLFAGGFRRNAWLLSVALLAAALAGCSQYYVPPPPIAVNFTVAPLSFVPLVTNDSSGNIVPST